MKSSSTSVCIKCKLWKSHVDIDAMPESGTTIKFKNMIIQEMYIKFEGKVNCVTTTGNTTMELQLVDQEISGVIEAKSG